VPAKDRLLEQQHQHNGDEGTKEGDGGTEGRRGLIVGFEHAVIRETVGRGHAMELIVDVEPLSIVGVGVGLGGSNIGVVQDKDVALASGDNEARGLVISLHVGKDGVVVRVLRSGKRGVPSVSVEVGLIEQIEVHILVQGVEPVGNFAVSGTSAERTPVHVASIVHSGVAVLPS